MNTIQLITIAATSGLALAHPVSYSDIAEFSQSIPSGTEAWEFFIDLSGVHFNDAQGSALNQILTIPIFEGAQITGIGWNVNLTSIGASWGSEAVMRFNGRSDIDIAVGGGDTLPVTNFNYASSVIDLTDAGFPNILIGADGNLEIEFFESFVDNGGTGDAFFEEGSILTIQGFPLVPSPGTLAMFGLGGLAATRRRRA